LPIYFYLKYVYEHHFYFGFIYGLFAVDNEIMQLMIGEVKKNLRG